MSKVNLELKNYCKEFGEIRKVLKNLGAEKVKVKKQKDYFFDLSNNKEKSKARLKIRFENSSSTFIYYERPDFSNKGVEAKINLLENVNKETFEFFKSALGIKGIVEKKREVWRLGDTVFHLDEVKNAGKIFEIELQKKGKISDKDILLFESYKNKVFPFLGKPIRGSNIDLVK